MLQCLSRKSSSSSSTPSAAAAAATPAIDSPPPPPPRRSQGGGTSSEASPSAALTNEYTLAVQSNSCNEIWSRIHEVQDHRHHDEGGLEEEENREQQQQRLLLGQVLQPNRECVEEALRHAKPNALTGLVSDYFEQSEKTTRVCLVLLHRSVDVARQLYAPLHQLLDVLAPLGPSLSLSQSQCSRALDLFLEFDRQANPFPSPDDPNSPNFDDMRRGFSQLKDQLDRRLRSSRSRIRFLRRATIASTVCLVGTAVGAAVSAVAITAHALTAAAVVVVAGPPLCCTSTSTSTSAGTPGGTRSSWLCSCMTSTEKKEIAHVKQLDAAAKGTCVLNNDLATIDRLVRRLHTAVEGDKGLVRLGLERGNPTGSGTAFDKHPIQGVLKQLGKSHPNFLQLLDELEEHIGLCFSTVNRARSLLLHHISTLQSTDNVN